MQYFTTFKRYTTAVQAQEILQLLEANGIACRLADNKSNVDQNFGKESLVDFEVQLYPQDFEKAEAILEAQAAQWINDLPQDHYLFAFTDSELREVVYKKDEWSELDYVLAKKLLADRGYHIDEQDIKVQEELRIAELAKPEDVGFWITVGYIMALLGGFFGVLTGYMVYYSKKTLPNGKKVYAYTNENREHAKSILIIGILVLIITVSWRIFMMM